MKGTKNIAIVLIGHGSRLDEANETLRGMARSIEATGEFACVVPAFLQMAKPDFNEAFEDVASRGFKDIVVMPYFLYTGAHVTEDIPAEIDKAVLSHPGVSVRLAKNLGMHPGLVELTMERIGEVVVDREQAKAPCIHPIEQKSFEVIGKELGATPYTGAELSVLKRVIHTTADFEFKDLLAFSPNAISAGLNAIKNGAPIITDVRMVETGISRERLRPFGGKVLCYSSDADVIEASKKSGSTRTAESMKKAAPLLDGSIVAIGNAPTALMELLRMAREDKVLPALIVGVPVGFVGAVEAKEELMASGCEHIATRGRKGGSTVAVAIINALAIEASKG